MLNYTNNSNQTPCCAQQPRCFDWSGAGPTGCPSRFVMFGHVRMRPDLFNQFSQGDMCITITKRPEARHGRRAFKWTSNALLLNTQKEKKNSKMSDILHAFEGAPRGKWSRTGWTGRLCALGHWNIVTIEFHPKVHQRAFLELGILS